VRLGPAFRGTMGRLRYGRDEANVGARLLARSSVTSRSTIGTALWIGREMHRRRSHGSGGRLRPDTQRRRDSWRTPRNRPPRGSALTRKSPDTGDSSWQGTGHRQTDPFRTSRCPRLLQQVRERTPWTHDPTGGRLPPTRLTPLPHGDGVSIAEGHLVRRQGRVRRYGGARGADRARQPRDAHHQSGWRRADRVQPGEAADAARPLTAAPFTSAAPRAAAPAPARAAPPPARARG